MILPWNADPPCFLRRPLAASGHCSLFVHRLQAMDEIHRSPGDLQRRSASRRANYLSEIHIEVVMLLVVVFVVQLAVGFSLRPASSGYRAFLTAWRSRWMRTRWAALP